MKQSDSMLMCGGGVMQLPAIRIARDEGFRVVVADGNSSCVGRVEADVFAHIDLKDDEALIRCARDHGVVAVCTAGTDFSLTVARVAEACGLPGVSVDAALHATDKALMRERLAAAGVSVPPFAVYRDGERVSGHEEVPLPAVVKPVASMGARGVRRISTPEELSGAIAAALPHTRDGRVIVESFIPGTEYSIDALVTPTQRIVCGIADRHIAIPPNFVETGHTIPTSLPDDLQALLIREFFRAVDAIGICPGAAKGDVFIVDEDRRPTWLPGTGAAVVIGEIAARLSGGYMSGWTYPYCSGVEPTRGAIRIAAGREPDLPAPFRNTIAAERAIMSIPGTLAEDIPCAPLRSSPGVKECFILVRAGDTVAIPSNNVEKCGNLIITGESRDELGLRVKTALSRVHIPLSPGNPVTLRFLLGPERPAQTVYAADERYHGPLDPPDDATRDRLCVAWLRETVETTARQGWTAETSPADEIAQCALQVHERLPERPEQDLQGFTRTEVLARIVRAWGARSTALPASCAAAVLLLSCERGGLQGLHYVIDTLTEEASCRKTQELLEQYYGPH